MLLYAAFPFIQREMAFFLVFSICTSLTLSYVGGMRGGEILHTEAHHFSLGWWRIQEAAGEDLSAGLAKVFRQEGVEDGVDAGVAIGQAVGDDTEGEGGVVQGEGTKLNPHGDDVVRHPADEEGHHHQEHRLGRLQSGTEGSCYWIYPYVYYQ